MLKSLEEADSNVCGFFDEFEGRREPHSLPSAIRQQITNVIPCIKTVNWNQLQTHWLLAQHGFCYVHFWVDDVCERQGVNSVYIVYS